jgi:hypothetical protein
MSCVDEFDWFPEVCCWPGLHEASSGTREDNRGALRNIDGDSTFTQPPLKVIEVRFQVADEKQDGKLKSVGL